MWVFDALSQVHLADEAGQHTILLAGLLRRQHFERDETVLARRFTGVVCQVNGPHASSAEGRENLIGAEYKSLPGSLLELVDLKLRQDSARNEVVSELVWIA